MGIVERSRELRSELGEIDDLDDRYTYIIERGREHGDLSEEFQTESFRVKGCMSKLWLVPEYSGERCKFRVDSDAAIVKGIAAILAELFSDATPQEILRFDAAFLHEIGLSQYLSPNRRNSLSILFNRFTGFAENCQAESVGE